MASGPGALSGHLKSRHASLHLFLPLAFAAGLLIALPWRLGSLVGSHLDLEVYRLGVEAWWHGHDVYGRLPITSVGLELPFIYPPFAVFVLSPLAILPWEPAAVVLFLTNLLCLGVTLFLVAKQVWPGGGRRGAVAVASLALPLALLLEPVSQTFGFGQVNLVLMGLVAVDCLTGRARWPRGLGVGLAAAIKLTPLAFVLFFLVRKDFRAAITATVTAVVASALAFAIDAEASMRYWFGGLAGAGGMSGSPFHTNQSIEAVLVRLGVPSATAKLWWLALALVLLVVAVVVIRRSEPVIALLANAGFALLTSPISWSHHWVWAAPALLMMVGYGIRRGRSPAAVGWWCAAVFTGVLCYLAPFRSLPAHDKPGAGWTAIQQVPGNSYAMLATVLLFGYAISKLKRGERPADAASP